MNGKISLQDGRHNDDNIVGNCVEKVNTEFKNLSESREIEKMWNQFKVNKEGCICYARYTRG